MLVKDPGFQFDWKNKLKRPVCITSMMDNSDTLQAYL